MLGGFLQVIAASEDPLELWPLLLSKVRKAPVHRLQVTRTKNILFPTLKLPIPLNTLRNASTKCTVQMLFGCLQGISLKPSLPIRKGVTQGWI